MIIKIILLLFIWHPSSALFLGDECTLSSSNAKGFCNNIHDCGYAKTLLQNKKSPQTCGFIGHTPLVCCPFPFHQNLGILKPGVLSQKMCNEYYDKKHQVFAIDLGEKARSKEFPHMAAVGYGDYKNKIVWLCGGSLISHFFILSAAHCIESLDYGPAKWIRLGDLDLVNTTEDANPQDIRIVKSYAHPLYRSSSHYHDIGLFKLENRTFFGLYFKPACLHNYKDLPVDTLEVTGWGRLGLLGESSSHLMKAKLKIIDHGTCARRYASVSRRKLKDGILDQYQMCAGDTLGRDTCPGDSGGPLHYFMGRDNSNLPHFTVAGVTSFGKGCGGENSVGVYTRVSAYVGWIENIVWGEGD